MLSRLRSELGELSRHLQRAASKWATESHIGHDSIIFRIQLRVDDVAEAEIAALRAVGLREVFIGIESGVPRLLREMRKEVSLADTLRSLRVLRAFPIDLHLLCISIIPTMSYEELKEHYEFLWSIGGYSEPNLYNKLNIYNRCEYEDILAAEGLLRPKSAFWERYSYSFKDPRVGLFDSLITTIRDRMLPSKLQLNKVEGIYAAADKRLEFRLHENARVNAWARIIRIALGLIDNGLRDVPKTLPEPLEDEIASVQRYTDRVLEEIQEETRHEAPVCP